MSPGQPNFRQHFDTAFSEFRELRRQQTRTSASGQKFVLIENVTARLRQRSESCPPDLYQDDLDRLRQTAYLRENDQPPRMQTHRIQKCLAIFYNLLEIGAPSLIHEFPNNRLSTLPIDRDVLKKRIKGPSEVPDFHEKFYRNQFAWCPIQFEMDMGTSYKNFHDIISPFLRKEQIKPYRDGKGPLVNTATLYAIEVPEELIGPKLKKKMASAKIEPEEGKTDSCAKREKRYRFALKQFKQSKYDHFENEKEMFINLANKDGMIQYIGWFTSYEPDEVGGLELYSNIVLELADFDFYTAIRKESPPISAEEILGFWKTMAEISGALASIYTVVIDNQQYLTWHGDIKPENILRVNDRFKLADPGEARMQLKSNGTTGDQRTRATGGTRTYADPEKAAYLDGRSSKKPEVPQTSDVWSLGCVLSIAATYVVLGTQGVLIFNQLRREAIFSLTGSSSDAFHDGKAVLAEVRHWHNYLREAARRSDVYTSAVLDMVDKHMLVEKDRWEAKMICQQFEKLFNSIKSGASRVPPSLHDLLQRIDLQSERSDYLHSGIRKANPDDMAIPMSQVPSLPPAAVEFESRETLLEQPIQPVAQRLQDRTALAAHSRNQSNITALTITNEDGKTQTAFPGRDSSGALPNEPRMSQTSTQSWYPDPPIAHRKAVTVWQVEQELETKGWGYRRSIRSFGSLFRRQPQTVKGKNISDNLEQLDQRLKTEFDNRDIVYLVDNGTTMASHWLQATHLLKVLVWRSLGYDDNGMELYFTNPDTEPKAAIGESLSQNLEHFTRAMKAADPNMTKSRAEVVDTTIIPELTRIINSYTRAKASKHPPRKKTIIILTDGIWKGMRVEHTIDGYLRSVFNELKDLHGDLPYIQPEKRQEPVDISKIRPVTIQFVQFGDDPRATARLRRLDDDMRLYGCPDLIDTEHAEGDVYKMFLGSLCQDIDGLPSIERQPGYLGHRSSFHGQDVPKSPVNHSPENISRSSTRASRRASQLPPVHDRPSSYTTQHHDLSASLEDPNSPNFPIIAQRPSTIQVEKPSPPTVMSPSHTGPISPRSSHEETYHEPSPVTPTSPIASSPSNRRQQANRDKRH